MKRFHVGDVVQIKRSPGSPFWIEANYVGLYTVRYGQRPWHLVQVNADQYSVPLNRIRAVTRVSPPAQPSSSTTNRCPR